MLKDTTRHNLQHPAIDGESCCAVPTRRASSSSWWNQVIGEKVEISQITDTCCNPSRWRCISM